MARDNPRLLLVDDDPSLLRLLTLRLEGEGYQVINADSAETALTLLAKQSVDVVLSDLRMPGLDGMSLFDEIAKRYKGVPVILMTAHGSIPEAVAATQRGVFGFLTKPLNPAELREVLQRALNQSLPEQEQWREAIITRSPLMQNVLEQAYRVAQRDVSVLITGASGTGKELLAKAIHNASPRAAKPFVAINCGALPEHLLESELFGHSKGAFTGAVTEHAGLFREADGGTLFLDEVGELALSVQAKLLRVLQNGEIQRLGSDKLRRVNVRLVAATNRDLQQQVKQGEFRADLYHRLSVYPIPIPPLRERSEDLPLLAGHFLEQNRSRLGLRSLRLAPAAELALLGYHWPGNIRELEHVISRAAIKALSQGAQRSDIVILQPELLDLPGSQPQAPALEHIELPVQGLKQAVNQFQQQLIRQALQQHQQCWSKAARALQLDASNLHKLAQRLGLK